MSSTKNSFFSLVHHPDIWVVIRKFIPRPDRKIRLVRFRDYTSLKSAASYGYLEILQKSELFQTIDPEQWDYTLFMAAAKCNNVEVIKWLVDKLIADLLTFVQTETHDNFSSNFTLNPDMISWLRKQLACKADLSAQTERILHGMIPHSLCSLVTREAVKHGNLEVVKYTHYNFSSVDVGAMVIAMEQYNYPLIEWMHRVPGIGFYSIKSVIESIQENTRYGDNRIKYSLHILRWLCENYKKTITFRAARLLTLQSDSMQYVRQSDLVLLVHENDPTGLSKFLSQLEYVCIEKHPGFATSDFSKPLPKISLEFLSWYHQHFPVPDVSYLYFFLSSVINFNKLYAEFLWNLAVKRYINTLIESYENVDTKSTDENEEPASSDENVDTESSESRLKDNDSPLGLFLKLYVSRPIRFPNWFSELFPEFDRLTFRFCPFILPNTEAPRLVEIVDPPLPYRDYMKFLETILRKRRKQKKRRRIPAELSITDFFTKVDPKFRTLEYFDKLFRIGIIDLLPDRSTSLILFGNLPRENYHIARYIYFMTYYSFCKNSMTSHNMGHCIIECLQTRSRKLFKTIRWCYHYVLNDTGHHIPFGIQESDGEKLSKTELCEFIKVIPYYKLDMLDRLKDRLERTIRDTIINANMTELIDLKQCDVYNTLIRAVQLKKEIFIQSILSQNGYYRFMLENSAYLQTNRIQRSWVKHSINLDVVL